MSNTSKVVQETVLILSDSSGEPRAFVRRDNTNHGRVRFFTVQTAGWDDVKSVLEDISTEPKS